MSAFACERHRTLQPSNQIWLPLTSPSPARPHLYAYPSPRPPPRPRQSPAEAVSQRRAAGQAHSKKKLCTQIRKMDTWWNLCTNACAQYVVWPYSEWSCGGSVCYQQDGQRGSTPKEAYGLASKRLRCVSVAQTKTKTETKTKMFFN